MGVVGFVVFLFAVGFIFYPATVGKCAGELVVAYKKELRKYNQPTQDKGGE